MSYIGNTLPANFQSLPAVQRFNGDGSDTTFTLAAQIANDQSILVSVDGVTQDSNAYSVSGTTLTFTSAPSAGTGNIFVNTISPVGSTLVPPDGSVTTAKLVDGSVSTAKLVDGSVSTAKLVDGSVSTAKLVDGSVSTAKLVDASVTGAKIGSNPFMFYGRQGSNQTIPRVTTTTITGMTTNEIDPSSAFDGTTFTVPSGGAGVYLVQAHLTINFNDGNDGETAQLYLFANGEKCTSRFQNASTRDTVYVALSCSTIVTLAVGNTIYMSTYCADNNGGTQISYSPGTSLGAYRIST